jgi:hypothetical protein
MGKKSNTDNTRNGRQARRREREKQWLEANGWSSWESLHTSLMKGEVVLAEKQVKDQPDRSRTIGIPVNFFSRISRK